MLAALLGVAGMASAAEIAVTIYADAGYPPYSYEKDGKPAGLYYEIAKTAVAGRHGWSLAGAALDSVTPAPLERWPTPTARDTRSGKASPATFARNSRPLSEVVGLREGRGMLNPRWVAWLMGLPLDWLAQDGTPWHAPGGKPS